MIMAKYRKKPVVIEAEQLTKQTMMKKSVRESVWKE